MPGDRTRPPPLPPRPLVAEPFPKAKSDPPRGGFRASADIGALQPVNRAADTPRSGGIEPPQQFWQPPEPSRELLERELANARALIAALQQSQEPVTITPVPPTRPSVRVRRAAMAKVLGKWTLLLTLLPLVGGVVAKRWPEYSGIVDAVLQIVGLR